SDRLLGRCLRIAVRHERLQGLWQWLREGGVIHLQGLQDVVRDVLIERLPGNALDNVARYRRRIVRVGDDLARREDARWHPLGQILTKRIELLRLANEEIGERLLEAGGVGHDVPERDRLAELLRDL